ncbi:MAG: hypothetical protein M0030_00940 [Actinomycetota bacterium]|nr:hypothetical protein [Actinomycetota bacterium]
MDIDLAGGLQAGCEQSDVGRDALADRAYGGRAEQARAWGAQSRVFRAVGAQHGRRNAVLAKSLALAECG